MKKNIAAACCMILLLMIVSVPCHANNNTDEAETAIKAEEESMVYAYGDELEEAYESILKEFAIHAEYYSLEIVKESITPIYTVDMLEYAETEKLEVKPSMSNIVPSEPEKGKRRNYIAKIITKDNEYGGFILFSYDNGVAKLGRHSPSVYSEAWLGNKKYDASPSYADHAERIARILEEEKPIPVQDVKFVSIGYVGMFFYIKNEKHDVLIPMGKIPVEETNNNLPIDRKVNTQTELLDIAKDLKIKYDAYLAEIEEWEKAHPGEKYDLNGGEPTAQPIASECSVVNNIIDIPLYSNIGYPSENNVHDSVESSGTAETTTTGVESTSEILTTAEIETTAETEKNTELNADKQDSTSSGCTSSLSSSAVLLASVASLCALRLKHKKETNQ